MEEISLIWKKIREGDEKAFSALYKMSYKSLHSYAAGILRSTDAAGELVDDVFLNLWQKRSEILIRGSLKAYLFRSVHNACINYISHLGTGRQSVMELVPETRWDMLVNTLSDDSFALEKIDAESTEKKIEAAINSLPDQCRSIFILSRFEMKSSEDIASLLGLSAGTVRSQIFRALEKIREVLKK